MQRDNCNIAEATQIWLALQQHDAIKSSQKARASVAQRASIVLDSGAFLAANILDPRHQGKKLSQAQLRSGVSFIEEQLALRFPELAASLKGAMNHLLAEGLPHNYDEGTSPIDSWKAEARLGHVPQELSLFACMALSCIASFQGWLSRMEGGNGKKVTGKEITD